MKKPFFFAATWLIMLMLPGWASTACISKANVNVRSKPSLKADVLFQAHVGYPVKVEKTKGKWAQVRDWQDNVGWVYSRLINQKISTAVVLPEKVNIRKGPGMKYGVVGGAESGEVYKIFEQKKGWVRVGYYLENQKIGWIRKDLVWGD
jgi:uncharacterized protein YgiM (DUF1202 family)